MKFKLASLNQLLTIVLFEDCSMDLKQQAQQELNYRGERHES